MDFKAYYANQQKLVENYLKNRIAKKGISKVDEAMEYSLMAGGKRIRPILLMAAAEAVGSKGYNYLPVACGLEMIHTYSLIHDDLPCMDNDDLRRGKPTNHKVYGEAIATLAGDGLLGLAFETALENGKKAGNSADITLEATKILAHYSGVYGMLGGQVDDIEKTADDEKSLAEMYKKKTSCLLMAAAEIGVLAGGGDERQIKAARQYAENIGIAFQIRDDILDVCSDAATLGKNIGSDAACGKTTFVTLYGVDGAEQKARKYTKKALNAAKCFDSPEILHGLAEYLINRKK